MFDGIEQFGLINGLTTCSFQMSTCPVGILTTGPR